MKCEKWTDQHNTIVEQGKYLSPRQESNPWLLKAKWIERPPGVRQFMCSCGGLWCFLCLTLVFCWSDHFSQMSLFKPSFSFYLNFAVSFRCSSFSFKCMEYTWFQHQPDEFICWLGQLTRRLTSWFLYSVLESNEATIILQSRWSNSFRNGVPSYSKLLEHINRCARPPGIQSVHSPCLSGWCEWRRL